MSAIRSRGDRHGLGATRGLQEQVIASQAQAQANEIALNGVREEARVGQRTTLDVLNAQQELLSARTNLIIAQRNRVIFSYGVVQAIGRLTASFHETSRDRLQSSRAL